MLILLVGHPPASAQIGLAVTIKENEVAPYVWARKPIMKEGLILLDLNLFPFTVIPKDPYNGNRTHASWYPLIRSIPVAIVLLNKPEHGGFEEGLFSDSSFFVNAMVAVCVPLFLSNSQFHVKLVPSEEVRNYRAAASVFVGMQTDYYQGDDANWFRFAPSLGVELATFTGEGYAPPGEDRHFFCFAVQAGVTSRFDISRQFSPKQSSSAFVTVKWGML